MSSDTLRSGPSGEEERKSSPQNPDIIEKQKRLEKLGIQANSEILLRIENDIWAKKAFIDDLSVLESNPSEKERFEQLWIKGFWQVVKINGIEYTYAKIAGMKEDEQMGLIEKARPEDQEKIANYIVSLGQAAIDANKGKIEAQQAAIKEWERIDAGTQAAIGSNEWIRERLRDIDTKLKDQVSNIENIAGINQYKEKNGVSKEVLRRNADTIPELKWATPEEIQSGTYDNILLADYYVRNATEIGKNLSPEDTKKFTESIRSLSDTLGRPRQIEFEKLAKQIVLWENREKIESAWKELIKSGYSKDVVWNPQERTITFTNSKGEKRIIDTARVPPTQRIEDGAVEITSTLPEKRENPYIKTRQKQEQDILKSLDGWWRLPLTGWKEVQSAPTVIEKLQKGISVLDANTKSITQALNEEEESAKKSGIEWETPQIKEYKKLLISIEALRSELVGKWSQLVIIHTQELSESIWTAPEMSMNIGKENLNNISKTGLGRFRNMDEVSSFLSTINNPIFGNNFSDRENINNYLIENKLTSEQLFSIFQKVVELYGKIVRNKTIATLSKEEKYNLITKQDENGNTPLENALNSERIKNDNRTLTRWDFERILWQSEN